MLDGISYYGLAAVSLVVAAMAGAKAGRLLGGWMYESYDWITNRIMNAHREHLPVDRASVA